MGSKPCLDPILLVVVQVARGVNNNDNRSQRNNKIQQRYEDVLISLFN